MSIEVTNPATGAVDNSYELMERDEVFAIIEQMEQVRAKWQRTDFSIRKQCMLQVAEILRAEVDDYASIITREMGKPISQAKAEINKCAVLCEYYAENAENFLQPELIKTESSKSYKCYQPLGIIFAIMPWNFPFWQVLRFAVPNLMGGNAGMLKHASNSTGAALAIEALFLKAGFPKDLFRSIVIKTSMSADVINHPLIRGVTLTGSERAGQAVGREAAGAFKKVVLELGGSDPYLVLADADLDLAAKQCIQSRLSNAGQICISAKRLIVIDEVYDSFVEKLLPEIDNYQCADPMMAETLLGPMSGQAAREEVHQQVQASIASGVKCLRGGKMPEGAGYYYPATLLTEVAPGMVAFDEEIFGPVVSVIRAKDDAHAIALANNSPYGLGAAVFSQDIAKAERIAREEIQAGTCNVNCLVSSDPRLPFGGIKNSGFGRELAAEGLHEFMNIKTVSVA